MNELLEYAKSVPYFPPNSCAWGHAALGFGVSVYMTDPWVQAAAAIAFVMYEVWREKPVNEKIGAVAEFATGFMAGKVVGGFKAK